MDEHSDAAGGRAIRCTYITKRELVLRSGLSASTIQRYKDRSCIPFYQPRGRGGKLLFPIDAIEAAVARFRLDEPLSVRRTAAAGPDSADGAAPGQQKLPGRQPRCAHAGPTPEDETPNAETTV